MTAPRTCSSCGADLPADVRWCLRCHEAVRELTPREAQLPPLPQPDPVSSRARPGSGRQQVVAPRVYTRWHAGPTTFGVWGRLALTGLVLLFLPWGAFGPTTFFYLMGYGPIALLVLRGIWRKEAVALPTEPVQRVLPDPRTLAALRIVTGTVGLFLAAVAVASGAGLPVTLLPVLPFLLAALFPITWDPAAGLVAAMQARPLGALVGVNVLNVVDVVISGSTIGSGNARELNPFVVAFGYPAKIAIVAACSWLLYRKRPQALVWPVLAFLGLTAYHIIGLIVISLG